MGQELRGRGPVGRVLEPLESTSIHLIQRAVLRILRLLPVGQRPDPADIAEFNEQQMTDMVQIRDFLILHYKATERRDSPFWRQCAGMEVPETWPTAWTCSPAPAACSAERGTVCRKQLGPGDDGPGLMPAAYHPVAAKLRDDELDRLGGCAAKWPKRCRACRPCGLCRSLLRRAHRGCGMSLALALLASAAAAASSPPPPRRAGTWSGPTSSTAPRSILRAGRWPMIAGAAATRNGNATPRAGPTRIWPMASW
jgi:hypothetical protein